MLPNGVFIIVNTNPLFDISINEKKIEKLAKVGNLGLFFEVGPPQNIWLGLEETEIMPLILLNNRWSKISITVKIFDNDTVFE